jgi:hypothetical protein
MLNFLRRWKTWGGARAYYSLLSTDFECVKERINTFSEIHYKVKNRNGHFKKITKITNRCKTAVERSCRIVDQCSAKQFRIFPLNYEVRTTRISEKYKVTKANTDRIAKSARPYMQRLLNSQK